MKPLIEYDKDSILSEEVFSEIFEQEDEIMKARMLLSFEDRAKDLGVKQKFEHLLKAYKKTDAEMRKNKATSRSLVDSWTNFSGPYENMKCGAWIADDNGIQTFNKDYSNEVVVCYHPILPIKRTKNLETGEEQIVIAYKRNHTWREITVPKDLVSSSNKIVSLSKLGISVTSENAKLLVKYLSDVENMNDDDIPVQLSSSKLGWINGGFLPYSTDILFDGDMRFKQVYESVREHGNWKIWQNHIAQLRRRGRVEVKFMLAASFASVLVSILGALPFIVDLWGETEGGKTVSLMVAASVWANPDESAYIGDFKTTEVALEAKADMLNHMPMMLDDTSKTSSRVRDNFEGVVYDLCSGKGKSRSNKELGMNRENRWKNVILTNGERPLNSYVSQGGAINRILEVECKDNVFADPQETAYVVKKNYGLAGKRFVEAVQKLGKEEIHRIQKDFQKQIHDDEAMQKQSIALSVLLTADKIATEHLFHDKQYITIDEAKTVLINRNDLSDNERCYRYLMDKIAMNPQRFKSDSTVERWGVLTDDYAVLYVQAFNDLCKSGGFSDKAFLSWADRNGLLQTQGGKFTKQKKIGGKNSKCIFIKMDDEKDADGFESADVYDQEELPFK